MSTLSAVEWVDKITMNLEQILEEFGLTQRQARVYLAALELGEASIAQIAQKAQIKRAGTYYVMDSLISQAMAGRINRGAKELYFVTSPMKLLEMIKRKKEILEENLPEFNALFNLAQNKPKVRLYEGIEGIKAVFEKTLEKKNAEIMAISPYSVAYKTAKFHGLEYLDWGYGYIKRRVKKNIFVRDIAEDSPESRERQEYDKEELRQTRLVPKEHFPFLNEIDIAGDWVAVISYREMMGLIIESKDFAQTLKAIFELAWLGAERLSTNHEVRSKKAKS